MSINEDFHADPRPLVADSITGVRSFAVDKLGRLTGVTHTSVWRPGVNTATCPTAAVKVKASKAEPVPGTTGTGMNDASIEAIMAAVRRASLRSNWAMYSGGWTLPYENRTRTDEHRPGAAGCQCGFWAYFDGSDDFGGEGRITGVVRGQGVVTVGSKGFRAEQAEIVALVDPTSPRPGVPAWHRWMHWLGERDVVASTSAVLGGLVGLAALAFGTAAAVMGDPAWLVVLLAVAGLVASFLSFSGWRVLDFDCYSDHDDEPASAVQWEAVRRNYADVPVYGSLKAALRDFPLTPPPAPEPITPDNTPNFWEMKA